MNKLFPLFLVLLLVPASMLAQKTDYADDCGRLVEASPGRWVPLNLCPDGTIPAKGCKCPGTVKWDSSRTSSRNSTRTNSPDTLFAVPREVDLEKYPILRKGELTARRAAEMGLHPVVLEKSATVYNHRRNIETRGRFAYDTLLTGTVAYADKDGKLVYKADCSNRIAEVSECPKCPPAPAATGAANKTGANGKGTSADTSAKNLASATSGWGILGAALQSFGKGLWAVAKFFWNWILPLLLFLALLAGLIYGLYLLARAAADAVRTSR